MTAAHCVDKEDSAKGDVLLGAFDMNDVNTAERIHVRQIYVHNSYIDASMGNDIAVLELERDPYLEDLCKFQIHRISMS